ncbi:hypothetical protein A2861_02615 [Candidatus Roizmanbacteria bacterium RIFCSPHIGHO2_01_FULL_38_15]|nr:MAG: hypothetical protein A2861_02615 [Candidatus Roizmanbacteria bacterium RIFCSPHIGHO2_01_FULL_38_15]OGK34285.1 MAG: hypothetical protein A3F59_05665 [Candidatus Roizmanbacteria bacterium RIFCSPHIGHO2_12_FULL_38_13]
MNTSLLIDSLTKTFSKNSLVKGLVLVGSQVEGFKYQASKYSDMEIYIIVDDANVGKIEKQLPSLVDSLGTVIFSYKNQWSGFSTVFDDLFRLELPVIKISDLDIIFSRPKAQSVKVLFDKTEGKLWEALDNRPDNIDKEKLFQEITKDFWYMMILGVQYYKKGEIWNARSVLQTLQTSLIKLFEILNDFEALLLETNKRVEQFLKEDQITLLKQVSPSYDEKAIKKSLKRMIEIFSETSEKIKKKYGFEYAKGIEQDVRMRLMKLFP